MATKTLTVVRPGRYGTRMLQAGDAFEVTAPEARLYMKLGWATERAKPYVRPAMDSIKSEVREIIADAVSETVSAVPVKRTRARKKTAAKK